MRKLVFVLIAFMAVVTFIRAFAAENDVPQNGVEKAAPISVLGNV
jgi:hypothetical protein